MNYPLAAAMNKLETAFVPQGMGGYILRTRSATWKGVAALFARACLSRSSSKLRAINCELPRHSCKVQLLLSQVMFPRYQVIHVFFGAPNTIPSHSLSPCEASPQSSCKPSGWELKLISDHAATPEVTLSPSKAFWGSDGHQPQPFKTGTRGSLK